MYNLVYFLVFMIVFNMTGRSNAIRVLREPSFDNPNPVYQLEQVNEDLSCTEQFQKIFEPEQLQTLMSMITLSGKSINDLGMYEG